MTDAPAARLDGVHHFTGVTADVTMNVDFWCRILGLRLVKKTLNYETTFRYHPYYGDENGRPGSVVTFLEFTDLPRGVPGDGNIQRIVLRVGSFEAADFWLRRLAEHQVYSEMLRLDPRQPTRLIFHDFEGHGVELMVSDAPDEPQLADANDIPAEFRIRGIEGARSYTTTDELLPFAEHLGFMRDGDRLVLRGASRTAGWYFSPRPGRRFVDMAVGVWHHMALNAGEEIRAWREYAHAGPTPYTQVFDHYFFDSAYSVSPGGVVELCSYGPGFTLDQPAEELGEGPISLSPWTEPLRAKLERDLTPIVNPRSRRRRPPVEQGSNSSPVADVYAIGAAATHSARAAGAVDG